MSTFSLEKERWHDYFDNFSRVMDTVPATLEVVAETVGDQMAAENKTLNGITYDPKDDVLELQLGDEVDHLIHGPKEIYITEDDNGFSAMEAVDKEGAKHILMLNP